MITLVGATADEGIESLGVKTTTVEGKDIERSCLSERNIRDKLEGKI